MLYVPHSSLFFSTFSLYKNCTLPRTFTIKLSKRYPLKVKCNEIWTNFLLSKNLYRNVICTKIKKNQLFEISFERTVALNTRKSDDFRELHENEPEMATLGVETNRYLSRHSWRAYLRGHIISLKSLSLFWRFSGIYSLANEQNRLRPWVLTWKCPNTAI